MNNTKRTLVVLAGLTALAASSSATLIITPTSTVSVDANTLNQADVQTINTNFASGPGNYEDMSSFTVNTNKGISEISVAAAGYLSDGGLASLKVWITDASNNSTTLFDQFTNNSTNGFVSPKFNAVNFSAGTYTVTYDAIVNLGPTDTFGSVDPFSVLFQEKGTTPPPPVPEPAPIAAMGLGLVGLMLKRRSK